MPKEESALAEAVRLETTDAEPAGEASEEPKAEEKKEESG
jgi:hypothetical protein